MLLVCALAMLVFVYASVYPKQAHKITHPIEYASIVQSGAQEFGLEEAHIYAVILCESSFREQAVSSVGAMGLMQIMPETGRWIAGKLGEAESFTEEKLFDPETNIRYGCWYLAYLSRLYDADLDTVSAAYHAGSGNVGKWLEDESCSADGRTIDTTPYPATNNYMEKVHSAYEIYVQRLLEEQ